MLGRSMGGGSGASNGGRVVGGCGCRFAGAKLAKAGGIVAAPMASINCIAFLRLYLVGAMLFLAWMRRAARFHLGNRETGSRFPVCLAFFVQILGGAAQHKQYGAEKHDVARHPGALRGCVRHGGCCRLGRGCCNRGLRRLGGLHRL